MFNQRGDLTGEPRHDHCDWGGPRGTMAEIQGFAAVNGAPLWQQAPSLLGRSVARGIDGFTSDALPHLSRNCALVAFVNPHLRERRLGH